MKKTDGKLVHRLLHRIQVNFNTLKIDGPKLAINKSTVKSFYEEHKFNRV